ncbi:MAG: AMP-binding protein, partial [Pseudomonadota bacterium]
MTRQDLGPSAYSDPFARAHLPPAEQWPELCFDLPELQYPARLNCVQALLDARVAAGEGQRRAVIGATETLSYAQLQARVDRICHVLRGDLGLHSGQRVLLRGANNPMMAACILAVLKCGLIAVPTMPLLRAKELATIIDKAKVNAVLCSASLRAEIDLLEQAPVTLYFGAADEDGVEGRMARHDAPFEAFDSAADDVCLISFTSGTTGVPKGTMHFHRDVLAICDCFPRHTLQAEADDVFIGTPPLAFTFGL